MTAVAKSKSIPYRNLFSFWIFGLCNNFAYSVMLSAAQDILNKHKGEDPIEDNVTDATCVVEITTRICSPTSTGVVLLCNIIPGLCVKMLCPFVMHRIPYWVRHTTVCVAQASSLIITAFADSVPVALGGVCLASFSSGLGETTYLGLAGHYSK
ncbi:CLN3 protein [Ancylostoma caninum]|uniref:Battenin n=1 Tax=Ancylostoma caninum TaxID=29170 RepID=A0A368FG07_ANCCA|nr:CLN3 protein [Ancylostoma caninum]